MAHEDIPLITQTLPVLTGRAEVLIAKAHLDCGPLPLPDEDPVRRVLTLWVTIDPPIGQRRAARAVAATYIVARCWFEQSPAEVDLGEWLTGLLDKLDHSCLSVVVTMPDFELEVSRQLGTWLARTRTEGRHSVDLAVAVARMPADWATCSGFDGWVLAPVGRRDFTAHHVFRVLSMAMAPGQAAGVDSEDLRVLLGTAQQPSEVVEAVWFPELQELVLADERARTVVATFEAVGFMPSRVTTFKSLNLLTVALREKIREGASFIMSGPYGLVEDKEQSDVVVTVTILAAREGPVWPSVEVRFP